jgi:hypothetical protein
MCQTISVKYIDCVVTIIKDGLTTTFCPTAISTNGGLINFYNGTEINSVLFSCLATPMNFADYYADLITKFKACKVGGAVTPPEPVECAKGDFMLELCGIGSDLTIDRAYLLAQAISQGATLSNGATPTRIIGYDINVYHKGDEIDGFTTTKSMANFIQGSESTRLKGGEEKTSCGDKCSDGTTTEVSDFSLEIKNGSCVRINLDLQ